MSVPPCSQMVSAWLEVADDCSDDGTATGFINCEPTGAHFFDEQLAACDSDHNPDDSTARAAWPPANEYPPKEKAKAEVTTTGCPSFSLMSTEIMGSDATRLSSELKKVPAVVVGEDPLIALVIEHGVAEGSPLAHAEPRPVSEADEVDRLGRERREVIGSRRRGTRGDGEGPCQGAQRQAREQSGESPHVADVAHVRPAAGQLA